MTRAAHTFFYFLGDEIKDYTFEDKVRVDRNNRLT